MKIGDLVTMDYADWQHGDQWGHGIVTSIEKRARRPAPPDINIVVFWSKLGQLSWEPPDMILVIK